MSVAIVTGASTGIGAEVASILAKHGYDLVLVNRSRERSATILNRIKIESTHCNVDVIEADLADQDAIAKAAQDILGRHTSISVLFNNAGVLLGSHELSKHGNEMHFQINTLAPYLLIQLLAAALMANKGRVMNVSSGAIAMTGRLRINDLRNPQRIKKLFGAYAQTKLALTTLTNALAKEFESNQVILRSADPGGTKTAMTRGDGMPTILRWLQPLLFRTPESAALELVDSLLAERFGHQTGVYLSRGQIRSSPADADNLVVQRQLLELCRSLTGK
jgi:NAD(P)-dependent dehydrogenase (short-subunit alcohol dehydrogenase family)